MFDREYTLVAHPRVRMRVAYRSRDGETAALSCSFDYRSDGRWTEEGTAVSLPEHPEEAGVEWQGLRLALYRDGERVLSRDTSSSLLSGAVEAVEPVDRVAPSVASKGRRLVSKAARRGRAVAETDGHVEMTQSDGTTVAALEPPAKATFEVYRGKDEKWRWRLVHDNGNVIADSGQGYSSKRAARKGIRSVKRNSLGATVEAVGGETERDVRSSSDAERDANGDVGTGEAGS